MSRIKVIAPCASSAGFWIQMMFDEEPDVTQTVCFPPWLALSFALYNYVSAPTSSVSANNSEHSFPTANNSSLMPPYLDLALQVKSLWNFIRFLHFKYITFLGKIVYSLLKGCNHNKIIKMIRFWKYRARKWLQEKKTNMFSCREIVKYSLQNDIVMFFRCDARVKCFLVHVSFPSCPSGIVDWLNGWA